MHFPGFTVEAAEFLTTEREIVGVGVDTLSLDLGMVRDIRRISFSCPRACMASS